MGMIGWYATVAMILWVNISDSQNEWWEDCWKFFMMSIIGLVVWPAIMVVCAKLIWDETDTPQQDKREEANRLRDDRIFHLLSEAISPTEEEEFEVGKVTRVPDLSKC